jgi:DNA-binding IclR family transcriptional regulator
VAAVPSGDGASADVLGWVDEDSRRAFRSVAATGPTTAQLLATELDWPSDRAEQALATLARRRLVRVDEGGYYPLPFQ